MTPDSAPARDPLSSRGGNTVKPDGARVKQLRTRQGLTQRDLADRMDCSPKTIENIENGKPIRATTLAELAEALGVEPQELVAPQPAVVPVEVRPPAETPAPQPPPDADRPKCSLLVVDDEPTFLDILKRQLSAKFEVLTAGSADDAQTVFARRAIDIILADQRMGRRTGIELLEWVQQHHPRTVRLLITGFAELGAAIGAINRGQVYHYVSKPWSMETLLQVLHNAAEKLELERRRDELLEELGRSNRELAANQRLLQRMREVERVVLTDAVTGLYNRRTIEELARFELKRHIHHPSPLSIGLIHLDQFTFFDSGDFETGDRVLEELGRILARSLRAVDSGGRLRGEQFLFIARETGEGEAARLGERILNAMAAARFKCNDQVIPITLRIGFAVAEAGVHPDLEAMVALAADALTRARAGGRKRSAVLALS